MDKVGIKKLAELSRLKLLETEIDEYQEKISDILKYIDSLKEATAGKTDLIMGNLENRNILREDQNPHESGIYTDDLLAASPDRKDNFVKVKKIL